MRLIPSWFRDMALGMAVLYFPITFAVFYVTGAPAIVPISAGPVVEALVSTVIIALFGGFSYALGALAFGWVIRLVKYVYHQLVALAR